ncbi:Fic family protein [Epsilonproteobacteria bacterium SCGC AD-308-O04]|nr:Fic family protein [Epsilonproteobacteria bacterium SCGC AD-308-O04]
MYFTPILPIDIKGNIDQDLLSLSEEVCIKSASLGGSHNIHIISSIKELLRKTNSYYSNKIESEGTHPLDIEKAMKKDFSSNEYDKKLQLLSLAHIDVQKYIEAYFIDNESSNIYSKHFILELHKEFYTKEGMDKFLDIHYENKHAKMLPGTFREDDVYVGKHIAPKFSELETMLGSFENEYSKIYNPSTKALKLLYALSAHHRLVWIHPFLDGNGRISRLFLDASLRDIQLDGYGLWNISRGLARSSDEYKKYLALADMKLQGATDGRGPLSIRGLSYYLKYMLETALDQIAFMSKNLQLSSLGNKIDKFVFLSEQGMLNTKPLPKYSSALFKELLINGEIPRGKVKDIINKSDRTATSLIKALTEMDYLESDTQKSAIRLKINAEFGSYLMPDLIPSR